MLWGREVCNLFCVRGTDTSVTFPNTFRCHLPARYEENSAGISAAKMSGTILLAMVLQKTLHMNQSLAECKNRLASIQSYRRQFLMVTKATVTSSKTVDFQLPRPARLSKRTQSFARDR